jgi:hypothetical protein
VVKGFNDRTTEYGTNGGEKGDRKSKAAELEKQGA